VLTSRKPCGSPNPQRLRCWYATFPWCKTNPGQSCSSLESEKREQKVLLAVEPGALQV
jgi:hypothetical protein